MIPKKIQFLILSVLGSLVIISCATPSEQPLDNPAYYDQAERIEGQIDSLLEDEKPAEALQWIIFYREKDNLSDLDLNTREKQALSGLADLFNKAIEKKDYSEALGVYSSLKTVGRLDILGGGFSPESIKTAHVRSLVEKERLGAAASLLSHSYVSLADFNNDDLDYLEASFTRGENREALGRVVAEKTERGLVMNESTNSFLNKKITMEDLIRGTVTVWVDKGLRLEGGVGYPDQVIGSGFFIDKKGYLLTNYHVIESEVDPEYQGHSKLFIKLSDDRGEKIPARVVGWDRHFDLALLKTEIEAPYVFSFSSDDEYSLGQQIIAIGSPGGLNNSITSGTVSAVNRAMLSLGETVQIDVPINPGNSGGPLLSPDGLVKGVIFAGIEDFEGINFAIYGSYVKNLLPSLYEGGSLVHPWLGLGGFQEYDSLETLYVVPDSPASLAGIERGDRILRINGVPVKRNQEARDLILALEPGTIVDLEWKRDEKVVSSKVALAERPDIPFVYAIHHDKKDDLIPAFFGMVLDKVRKDQYRVSKVYTGSYADEASISNNDVISLKKWQVFEDEGYVLMQFLFKGVKIGYLESVIQLGAALESAIFF